MKLKINLKPSLKDLLTSSVKSILKNKGRTVLTSLGIIIGVTSVILLVSIGNGLKGFVSDQFESLGSNLIFISPGNVFNESGGFSRDSGFISLSFDQKDIRALNRDLKSIVKYVIPVSQNQVDIKYGNTQQKNTLFATSPDYFASRNQYPQDGQGRVFSQEEDLKKGKVVVLGWQVAQDLFTNRSPIGKKVIIESKSFKVIGVIPKQGGGGFGGPSFDDYLYVPLQTGQALTGKDSIQAIQLSVKSSDDVDLVKKQAETTMLKRYDEDDFSVFDQNQLLSSINTILSTLTVALSGIAAISLVVGGIGIMNIMLVTVTERTREIGLRKAVGAYPRAILLQFLFEAVILSGLGGLVGIILGSLGTLAINNFFPAKVTLSSILLAFGVSSLVGIIFGVAPARKASRLSPIEALRYE